MRPPKPGRIVTFYSYKGGTGRSMALANFAWLAAANGGRVLAIDWDLEAPGLHRYFRPFLVDPDLFETDGLTDAFWALAAAALASQPSQSRFPNSLDSELIIETFENATRQLDWKFATGGIIDFIGAGRQGQTYSEAVNTFDWKRFYDLGGAAILDVIKDDLRSKYDWILIDSRTGVSDTSGICTMQMPDIVVPCFTLNRQSIEGVTAILHSIREYQKASPAGLDIKFFPLATRIENAEKTRLEMARAYARTLLAQYLPEEFKTRGREYWDTMEIAYRPAYAFEEVLAAFGDATGAAGSADTMLAQGEAVARRITGNERLRAPEIVDADRAAVLKKYALGESSNSTTCGVPDSQDTASDTDFLRGLHIKEQQWRNSGFYWRRLLSRRELDLLTDADKKAFGRNMSYYLTQSESLYRYLRIVSLSAIIIAVINFVCSVLLTDRTIFINGYYDSQGYYHSYYSNPPIVIFLIFFMIIWVISSWLWSVVISRARPYGMSPLQQFLLVLRGPLRSEVRDYLPDASQSR